MKLGNHTIGVRDTVPRVDGGGNPVLDDYGDPVVDPVDRLVEWCLVTPNRGRTTDNDEPEDRSAPLTIGTTLLAPPGTGISATSVIVWPVTGVATDGETVEVSGPTWQVIGEVGVWDESEEARLRRSK